jgi:hypothetical protein
MNGSKFAKTMRVFAMLQDSEVNPMEFFDASLDKTVSQRSIDQRIKAMADVFVTNLDKTR